MVIMVDNNNDKPFACKERGCIQKFANFDHLVSHQKKHKMCLKLNSSSSTSTAMLAIVDQTPTPSKILGNFLQNCEDVGLYNEITSITPIASSHTTVSTKSNSNSVNPFDVSFGNAIKNNNKSTLKTPDNSKLVSDSPLNTPSIFYNNEGLMAIADAAAELNTPDHHYSHMDTNNDNNQSSIATIDSSLSSISSNGSYIDGTTLVSGIENHVKDKPSKTNNVAKQQFQAVSVICNANTTNLINSTINQIPSIVITQPTNKDKNLKLRAAINSVKANAIIAPKTKESSFGVTNTNSLYKVILKLPDGRSVQLPLVQQPISSIVTSSQSVTSVTNASKNSDSDTTNKDIIVNHINIGANASQANHSSLNSLSSLSTKDSLESRERALSATLASLPPRAKPGRKSKFAPEEDPQEKKARSLERNRAAAMRCRLKRKQWIDSLEEKADELGKINEKLQNEVVGLRREVTLLKTALLAHKDCPVTQQQLKLTNVTSIPIGNGNGNDCDSLTDHLQSNGRT